MRYTLKDYQEDAVGDVLSRLTQCREDFHKRGEHFSFALSATTGSGKTVIAATVIEALIHGSTEFDFEPDPGAVVLWISKDPSLNEQTKSRIIESADRIPVGDLVLLDKDYADDQLQKGTVYFINPAKLSAASLFVRRTNDRQFTFWDILNKTIKDPNLTLYVVLDEAHEGMKPVRKSEAEERQTIVRMIINGNGEHDPVPIVWGISATVDRFTAAMAQVQNRTNKSNVSIDPIRVQKSGLLKNSLVLDIPDESGDFETTMIRDATIEFAQVIERWDTYAGHEGLEDAVVPLLVVQIPNKEDTDEGSQDEDRTIVRVLDTIRTNLPDFTDDCVAHVLGDRGDIRVAAYEIPRIKPQNIQSSREIRVLLAKDAVSTGWDCPRAEVLVSLRPAVDRTYITQLLGRMVRTPLARSTNDDRLNSASCFLPHFNRSTAKAVAEEIMGIRIPRGEEAPRTPIRVLFSPVDLVWNPHIPEAVGDLLSTLPSLAKPAAVPRPIKRVLQAALALAQDGLVEKPNAAAMELMFSVLDGAMAQYKADVDAWAKALMEAEIRRFTAERGTSEAQESALQRPADENTIKDAFGQTRRVLTAAVANGYLKRLYEEALATDIHADLTEIQARVAALSRVEKTGVLVVVEAVESAADKQARDWLDANRDAIALLSEKRRDVYEEIRGQAREPELVGIEIPTALRVEGSTEDGTELERASKHVLSDSKGEIPVDPKLLNTWERAVLKRESARNSLVAWYRNPSAAGKHSLRVPYKKDGAWKSLQPDFIFVDRNSDGELVAAMVDPHSGHLADALPRLVGLADFAEAQGDKFSRIDSIDKDKSEKLRVLDMKDANVRTAVRAASSAGDLFNGPPSRPY
jgi:type III restriction enzyme